jgi:hypothetical protein
MSTKALQLLATDGVSDERTRAIRESAEQKIAKLKGHGKK